MPLTFSEEPGAGLVAVTLTGEDGEVVQTRVVSADELPRITARARALVARGDATAFVTLDELVDDIGVDAARWFLLQRSHDTTIDLDLELAKRESAENPVYYVQYAHARIAGVLVKAGREGADVSFAERTLPLEPGERALIMKLLAFPGEVAEAAERRAPHRMTAYSLEVARSFSAFYRDCQVVGGEDEDFRIALSVQARRVIAQALDLLGVEAPESM